MPSATAVRERPILFSGEMVRAILDGRKTQTRRVVKLPPWSTGEWDDFEYDGLEALAICENTGCLATVPCPYGQPGDRLWVRETWQAEHWRGTGEAPAWWHLTPPAWRGRDSCYQVLYAADRVVVNPPSLCYPTAWEDRLKPWFGDDDEHPTIPEGVVIPWRPSIHMPRWASRLTLEVTEVRVERVQEISEEDARAEGVPHPSEVPGGWPIYLSGNFKQAQTCRDGFAFLWDRLNASRGYGWEANPWVWTVSFRRVEEAADA